MPTNLRATELQTELLAVHGELMSGRSLWMALGFKAERGFQRAAQRGALPVGVFELKGRRGRFAKTREIAAWLASVGTEAPLTQATGAPANKESDAM